jgi:hypothetical protein
MLGLQGGGSRLKVLALTAWKRPDYVRRTLDALSRCPEIGDYLLIPHVEPGCDETRHLISSIDFAECRPTWNTARLGSDPNIRAAVRHGLALSDYVVYMDEDALFARDALAFYEWAGDRYRDDPGVASVTAYNRNREAAPEPATHYAVSTRPWFHCFCFALWRDRLPMVDGPPRDGSSPWGSHALREFVTERGMSEVYPVLGRVDHIGHVTSLQTDKRFSPEWFEWNHGSGNWAGNVLVGDGTFHDG